MHSAVALPAARPRLLRRFVLGTAFLLALAVGLAPRTSPVHAQPATPAPPAAAPAGKAAPDAAAPPKSGTTRSATINIKTDDRSVTIDTTATTKPGAEASADEDTDSSEPDSGTGTGKGKRKRMHVGVFGGDREYDSFNDFVHTEPGLAFMVVSIVALVFLSPVLAIALILWYRMRKQRMLNETMLKLAEKGVVPPAEALGALAGSSNAVAMAPSAAPIYEQAKQIRRRAAWSDLRKGVILGGIGLGLVLFSMLDDGTPNGLGLVLLFVGIGYIVLWWFEERQLTPKGGVMAPPAPPSGGTDGKV